MDDLLRAFINEQKALVEEQKRLNQERRELNSEQNIENLRTQVNNLHAEILYQRSLIAGLLEDLYSESNEEGDNPWRGLGSQN